MGGKGSGRTSVGYIQAQEDVQKAGQGTQQILSDVAPKASMILSEHIRTRKQLSASRQRACEYVIDHAIGKARQKIEHSGGILTYGALAKSAQDQEQLAPELLIDPTKVGKN